MVVITVVCCRVALAANSNLRITLCYEDKEVVPFYMGQTREVPTHNPGANIEVIQQLQSRLENVRFVFIRRPWKRCLDMVEKGEAQALIGSYRKQRLSRLRYPMINDDVDTDRALSKVGSCFIGNREFHEFWPRRHYLQQQGVAIALPHGYAIAQRLNDQPVFVHFVFSQQDAYRLLANRRVHAVMDFCQVGNQNLYVEPADIQGVSPLYPPFDVHYGYLIFAPKFYQAYPHRVERIWDALKGLDTTAIYRRYLQIRD